jgi:asparagine synthase (glutamine-hydrolysing)
MNNNLAPAAITSTKNILTLRYDPTLTTFLPKKSWQDFAVTSNSYSADHIEALIENAIKNFSKSIPNNRYSVALSGGIDSTLAIALLRKTLPDAEIDAISVSFADSIDESEMATKIATHFEANIHTINIENYLADLPKALHIIRMPFWDIHWLYVVMKSNQLSKVLVSGDGGDELFGGYTFRYEKFLSNYKPNLLPIEKTKLYLDCHQRDWVPDQDKMFGKNMKFDWTEIYQYIDSYFDNPLDPINQVFLADFNGKLLYNWVPLNKSLHDYFGIKSLSPLLSNELISYATHLSPKVKYDEENKIGKIPLRELLRRYVPKELISSGKHGFSVNTVNLWKTSGKEFCERYLIGGRVIEDGWIDGKWVQTKLQKLKAAPDVRYVNKFLGLLAFEIWYRLFITKEMKPDTVLN